VSFFVHSQNAQRETKTHTTHDARIFGDDGIVSVIAKMKRKKNKSNEILMTWMLWWGLQLCFFP
jgi:hypothetical protein